MSFSGAQFKAAQATGLNNTRIGDQPNRPAGSRQPAAVSNPFQGGSFGGGDDEGLGLVPQKDLARMGRQERQENRYGSGPAEWR
ncbi:MAG: hypothetical protein KC476_06150 [Cyanobacteria bacterium HKST-UBA06]|nr:hypothetical protein [Cyanobacteria bacterium HKST-UBA06]